jgi:hypothetical protein
MNGFEGLEESRYLLDAYLSVATDWYRFEQAGDEQGLRSAADTLCGAFGRLQKDGAFWASVIDAIRVADKDPGAIREILSDLGQLREFEEGILVQLGFPPELASHLVSDLVNAVEMAGDFPSGASIKNLESRLGEFRERICEVASAGEEDAKEQRKGRIKRVKQGLKVLGGAVTIVGNGVAATAFLPAAASIVAGVATMLDALPDGD